MKLIVIAICLISTISFLLTCTYSTNSFKAGEKLYLTHCASCHGTKAEGLGEWYPNITKNLLAIAPDRNLLALKIKNGISQDSSSKIKSKYHLAEMPANKSLNEIDICNILNYLNNEYWKEEAFTITEIKNQLFSTK